MSRSYICFFHTVVDIFLVVVPGLMGEGRTKRVRDNEATENSRKAARMDQDDVEISGGEVALGGTNAVKGLPNFGNTCYLNALVQCLLALNKLREIILKADTKLGLMGIALKDLFVKTSSGSCTGIMDPALVIACVRASNSIFKGKEMQDSQELFLSFLSRLVKEEEEDKDPSKPPQLHDRISLLFSGEICLRNSCSCSKVRLDYLSFDDLGLPMPEKARNTVDLTEDRAQNNRLYSPALIEDCLKLYFKEEKISFCCSSTDNEQTVTNCVKTVSTSCSTANQKPGCLETVEKNLPHCLSAEKEVTLICAQDQNDDTQNQERAEEATENEGATRTTFITKLPPVLVLYLQRYASEGSNAIKLSGHVSFEELLNIGQFIEPRYKLLRTLYSNI
jgi:ubiquitin carboxyl-terminal hydrolase 16/45